MVRRATISPQGQPQDGKIKPMKGMATAQPPLEQAFVKANEGDKIEHSESDGVRARKYAERLNALNEGFYNARAKARKDKKASLEVIDDNRIIPSERLKMFVKIATEQGYDPQEAIEFALKRMEQNVRVPIEPKIEQKKYRTDVDFESLLGNR